MILVMLYSGLHPLAKVRAPHIPQKPHNFPITIVELFNGLEAMFLFRTEDLPQQLTAAAISRDLARGEVLYRQGEPAKAVFICTQGRLQLCTSNINGKHVPLYTIRAGECVAEAALFADHYCSDLMAEVRSRVVAFPQRALREALHERPDLAAEFMAEQAKRCGSLRTSLELRSLRSARERILQYVHIFAEDSQTLKLDRSLKNVADDLGLTHENFYRTLAELTEEGALVRTKYTLRLIKQIRPNQILNFTRRSSLPKPAPNQIAIGR